ncbi:MAG: bifunctional UDP-N-acetylglucosamine diphosphorylase/glucosamine-1-phosphate N-acetyltransferase GlmU [Defluviitaleaceae bacterium]|nr:bifunctional UDP-N-acetylglucosamine diphosphorylase/glucosamine-1-phosphate N-acetyltransferase GlmU [Defluviitaleaceae bacterium]
MSDFVGILIAAGNGTRMKSKKPKMLHKIFDITMIKHSASTLISAGASSIIIIVGHKRDMVIEEIKSWDFNIPISIAIQEEQLGTGHAAKMAIPFLQNEKENIVIMYGDTPLIQSKTVRFLVDNHSNNDRDLTIMSTTVPDSTGYGRIIRESSKNMTKIVEEKDALPEEKEIKEINPGLYCFNSDSFKSSIKKIKNDNANNEYYITDTIEILISLGCKVDAVLSENYREFIGINDKIQLSNATKIMQKRINEKHMLNGVILIDERTTYISPNVEISEDVTIYPNTILNGNTKIENDCIIGPNVNIQNSIIGEFSKIQNSTILDSIVGDNNQIGPYAYIRPNSKLGNNIKIGNFVEVKNSIIEDNSKASHLTYVGDAVVGKNVNLGCGVITVNYDGKNKHKTTIKDGAFVGCNANLIAPVILEEDSFVAAGTTVTKKVDTKSLAIGRTKQSNIQNWVK